jgi:hypothetical protein
MRQIFTSPRLENVEGVAKLLTDAGIEIKVSEGRSYKKFSRREFSYVERGNDSNNPSIWVIKSDDYKRAREMLHDFGLLDSTPIPSYLPAPLKFKLAPATSPQKRLMRIKLTLLFVVGALVGLTVLKMAFSGVF